MDPSSQLIWSKLPVSESSSKLPARPSREAVSVGPITIEVLNGVISSARSGVTGHEFKATEGKTISIPRVEMHEVVVVALR